MSNNTKVPVLKTARLLLTPMTDHELEQRCLETDDRFLQQKYIEKLETCRSNPMNRIWYTPWKICLRKDKTVIGEAWFAGPAEDYSVEIDCEIKETYRRKKYGFDAIYTLIGWAFTQEGIYFVEAEPSYDNEAGQKFLEKLEFKEEDYGMRGMRYVKEQFVQRWFPAYIVLGLSIGLTFAQCFPMLNIYMGMCLGAAIGWLAGVSIDNVSLKKRKKIREERRIAKGLPENAA